ncbi:MAG: hypothetical protein AAFX05_02865 [Planctomycetota bacterium]
MSEKPHSLGDVLGSVLCALSKAQYMSDEYTSRLQKIYEKPDNPLNPLGTPNAMFSEVRMELQYAVADVRDHKEGDEPPDLMVDVDSSTLRDLPEWVVSTFHLTMRVADAEPTRVPGPQGSGSGGREPSD